MSTLSVIRESLEGSRYKEVPSHVKDSLQGEPCLTLRQEQGVDQQQSLRDEGPWQWGTPLAPAVLRAILLPAGPGSWLAAFLLSFTRITPPGRPVHPVCLYMTTALPCTDPDHQRVYSQSLHELSKESTYLVSVHKHSCP